NLMNLAERPFDLKALIAKWQADGRLGSRLDVLRRMIELQLLPLVKGPFVPRMPAARARGAARALAAAVTLPGRAIISLPEGVPSADRIDPRIVLSDWSPTDIQDLLRTGLFDDIVYTSVRFRHREIRELLTAEWACDRLGTAEGRAEVEALF